jgi:hypothetical protein
VTADSLFEAAALGQKLLKEHGWVETRACHAAGNQVSHPSVRHEVTVDQIQRWMESTAITPEERVKKDRVRAILG